MEIYNDTYCVYVHINKINGKMYVGQTCDDPERRWKKNGTGYLKKNKAGDYNQAYMAHAINKYGWDNFDRYILATNLTQEEANKFEYLLIKELDLTNPDKGYNLRDGGKNGRLSDATKKKLRDNHADFRGDKHPQYGKHRSEETKKKISETKKIKFSQLPKKQKIKKQKERKNINGSNNPHARGVIQYDNDGNLIKVWDCISQASKELQINKNGIIACCRDRRKSAGGFVWRYVD